MNVPRQESQTRLSSKPSATEITCSRYYIDFHQCDSRWNVEPVRRLLDDIFYKSRERYLASRDLDPGRETMAAKYPCPLRLCNRPLISVPEKKRGPHLEFVGLRFNQCLAVFRSLLFQQRNELEHQLRYRNRDSNNC